MSGSQQDHSVGEDYAGQEGHGQGQSGSRTGNYGGGGYPRPRGPTPYPINRGRSLMGSYQPLRVRGPFNFRGRGQSTHTRWRDDDQEGHVSLGSSPSPYLQETPPPPWGQGRGRGRSSVRYPGTNAQYPSFYGTGPSHFSHPFPSQGPSAPAELVPFGNNAPGGNGTQGQENWRIRWQDDHNDAFAPHDNGLAAHHRDLGNPFQTQSSFNPFSFQNQTRPYQSNFNQYQAYQTQSNYFPSPYPRMPFPNQSFGSSGLFERRDWGNNSFSSYNYSSSSSYRSRRLSLDVFPRQWEQVRPGSGSHGATAEAGIPISVLCYNVLSPALLREHQYLYKQCNPAALGWSYRKHLFQKEIEFYEPDVVCLQEVEADLVHEYDSFFQGAGYSGVFKKRTGDKVDGCGIYYRDNKFNLLDSISVEYCQKGVVPLLDRDNIGLLVKLETIPDEEGERSHKVVVATTHLLFNQRRNDIKIGQAMLLLAELDRISCYGMDDLGNPLYHPTIVTGDFNVDPNHTIAQLFTDGSIPVDKTFISNDPSKSIPSRLGISEQCQHHELERRRRQLHLSGSGPNFEFHSSETEPYINLTTSIHHFHPEEEVDVRVNVGRISLSQVPSFNNGTDRETEERSAPQEKYLQDDENGTKTKSGKGRLTHAFNFKDVYGFSIRETDTTENEMENFVTTQHKKWVRVDFIYYSTKPQSQKKNQKMEEGPLKLIRRLKLPTRSECKTMGKIPAEGSSSDHFPLLAEFLLTSDDANQEDFSIDNSYSNF